MFATQPDPVHLVPLDAIDDAALSRDRTGLDPEPLAELQASIAASGLRQPIEIFPLAEPRGGRTHGVLSGFRRLHVFRALFGLTGQDKYAFIPAFLREPPSVAAALAAMVEENEIRADLSPWEKGMIAVTARDQGVFGTIEEAVEKLYAAAPAYKRSRLRTLAHFAAEMEGQFTAPETLSQAQIFRMSKAVAAGLGELIRTALQESSVKHPDHQWALLQPILAEAEEAARAPEPAPRPGRPRRVLRPRHGLTIRRERARDGWTLHFTGREATGMMMDTVLDEIERMYSTG